MMVPMKQPITEQTGKVVVGNNTNQFDQKIMSNLIFPWHFRQLATVR